MCDGAVVCDQTEISVAHLGRPVTGDPLFAALLERYRGRALASPFRSTVPLLACWYSFDIALANLAGLLGERLSGAVRLSFEHCVPVQRGDGTPSQTDLLIDTTERVVAIEAKYTEPGYETVASWLSRARTEAQAENRRLVLQGWLDLINGATGASLTPEQAAGCTYQLIHRTASACAQTGRPWRAVVYQCFHDDAVPYRGDYLRRLQQMNGLLGPQDALRFYLLTCRVRPMPRYEALRARWRAGERDLSAEIREGLRDNTLLRCEGCEAIRV